jgi:hypothetical protein
MGILLTPWFLISFAVAGFILFGAMSRKNTR